MSPEELYKLKNDLREAVDNFFIENDGLNKARQAILKNNLYEYRNTLEVLIKGALEKIKTVLVNDQVVSNEQQGDRNQPHFVLLSFHTSSVHLRKWLRVVFPQTGWNSTDYRGSELKYFKDIYNWDPRQGHLLSDPEMPKAIDVTFGSRENISTKVNDLYKLKLTNDNWKNAKELVSSPLFPHLVDHKLDKCESIDEVNTFFKEKDHEEFNNEIVNEFAMRLIQLSDLLNGLWPDDSKISKAAKARSFLLSFFYTIGHCSKGEFICERIIATSIISSCIGTNVKIGTLAVVIGGIEDEVSGIGISWETILPAAKAIAHAIVEIEHWPLLERIDDGIISIAEEDTIRQACEVDYHEKDGKLVCNQLFQLSKHIHEEIASCLVDIHFPNGSSLLSMSDILDWSGFLSQLVQDVDDDKIRPGKIVFNLLPNDVCSLISTADGSSLSDDDKSKIIKSLNNLLERKDIYQEQDYSNVDLPKNVTKLLERNKDELSELEIQKLNRLLIETAYPHTIAKRVVREIEHEEVKKSKSGEKVYLSEDLKTDKTILKLLHECGIVGASRAYIKLIRDLAAAARADNIKETRVIFLDSEPGCGKEMLAKLIHLFSRRGHLDSVKDDDIPYDTIIKWLNKNKKFINLPPQLLDNLFCVDQDEKEPITVQKVLKNFSSKYTKARLFNYFTLNMATLSEERFFTELFGKCDENGDLKYYGRCLLAHTLVGTVFLDEFNTLPTKESANVFLRLLEKPYEMEIPGRLKGPIRNTNMLVIIASNKSRDELIEAGFNEAVVYRATKTRFRIPPLRERPADIAVFVNKAVWKYNKEMLESKKEPIHRIDLQAMRLLCELRWPDNYRGIQGLMDDILGERVQRGIEHRELTFDEVLRGLRRREAFQADVSRGKTEAIQHTKKS